MCYCVQCVGVGVVRRLIGDLCVTVYSVCVGVFIVRRLIGDL